MAEQYCAQCASEVPVEDGVCFFGHVLGGIGTDTLVEEPEETAPEVPNTDVEEVSDAEDTGDIEEADGIEDDAVPEDRVDVEDDRDVEALEAAIAELEERGFDAETVADTDADEDDDVGPLWDLDDDADTSEAPSDPMYAKMQQETERARTEESIEQLLDDDELEGDFTWEQDVDEFATGEEAFTAAADAHEPAAAREAETGVETETADGVADYGPSLAEIETGDVTEDAFATEEPEDAVLAEFETEPVRVDETGDAAALETDASWDELETEGASVAEFDTEGASVAELESDGAATAELDTEDAEGDDVEADAALWQEVFGEEVGAADEDDEWDFEIPVGETDVAVEDEAPSEGTAPDEVDAEATRPQQTIDPSSFTARGKKKKKGLFSRLFG